MRSTSRPAIYMYFVFPIPAMIFVTIMGAIAFYLSLSQVGGVANATHLGAAGRLPFSRWTGPSAGELKVPVFEVEDHRVRKKFDV